MATIRIPQDQWTGFEKLVALDDESVRTLATALREDFPGLSNPPALAEMASRAVGISLADAEDVMGVLATLYILRARRESPIPDFIEELYQALDEAGTEGLAFSEYDRARFGDRLALLLDVESISVESKAVDVQYDNERTFHSARIVTDIRPIFGSDPQEPPTGAVIVHMLRITYRERNRTRDLFVALDSEDVGTLSELAKRAHSKATSLKSFLAGTELPYMGPDEG